MDAIASSSGIENMQLDCRSKRKIRNSRRVVVAMQLPPERKNKGRLFLTFPTLAMQVNGINAYANNIAFNTNLGPIDIDN